MSNESALAAALAGEDAAIYGYGVISALLAGAARRRALDALGAHQSWRNRTAALMGWDTAPLPAVAYDFPSR